jgi:signal peptidase I
MGPRWRGDRHRPGGLKPPPAGVPAGPGAWLRDAVLAALLGLFVLVFLFQPFRVEGVSMLPGLRDRDRIIVSKLSYRLGAIERGDVVVFWFPDDPSKSFVKRVIGLPGDVVEIRDGAVLVNGRRLSEPWLRDDYRLRESRPPVEVEPGFYYVLGDHRSHSFDSRLWGLVPERYINGKVVLAYWPPERAGVVGR